MPKKGDMYPDDILNESKVEIFMPYGHADNDRGRNRLKMDPLKNRITRCSSRSKPYTYSMERFIKNEPKEIPYKILCGFYDDMSRKTEMSYTRVLVTNLHYGVITDDMKELFAEFNPVKVIVNYDKYERPLGTANIIFERRESALRAVKKYNNVELDGLPMKIRISSPLLPAPGIVKGQNNGILPTPSNSCGYSDSEQNLGSNFKSKNTSVSHNRGKNFGSSARQGSASMSYDVRECHNDFARPDNYSISPTRGGNSREQNQRNFTERCNNKVSYDREQIPKSSNNGYNDKSHERGQNRRCSSSDYDGSASHGRGQNYNDIISYDREQNGRNSSNEHSYDREQNHRYSINEYNGSVSHKREQYHRNSINECNVTSLNKRQNCKNSFNTYTDNISHGREQNHKNSINEYNRNTSHDRGQSCRNTFNEYDSGVSYESGQKRRNSFNEYDGDIGYDRRQNRRNSFNKYDVISPDKRQNRRSSVNEYNDNMSDFSLYHDRGQKCRSPINVFNTSVSDDEDRNHRSLTKQYTDEVCPNKRKNYSSFTKQHSYNAKWKT